MRGGDQRGRVTHISGVSVAHYAHLISVRKAPNVTDYERSPLSSEPPKPDPPVEKKSKLTPEQRAVVVRALAQALVADLKEFPDEPPNKENK